MVCPLSAKRTRSIRNSKLRRTKQVSLIKWLFKLCNEEEMWQDLLRNNYVRNKTFSQVNKKACDSHFWSSLMGVKNYFLTSREVQTNRWEPKKILER